MWRKDHPDKARLLDLRRRLKQKYNISPQQLEQLIISRGGKCWLCGEKKRLFIDHNHVTGQVRGLLCPICNTLLGHLEKHPEMLGAIPTYLDQPCHADVLLEIAGGADVNA